MVGRLLFDQLRKLDTLDEAIDALEALSRFDAQRIVLAFLSLAAEQERGETASSGGSRERSELGRFPASPLGQPSGARAPCSAGCS